MNIDNFKGRSLKLMQDMRKCAVSPEIILKSKTHIINLYKFWGAEPKPNIILRII